MMKIVTVKPINYHWRYRQGKLYFCHCSSNRGFMGCAAIPEHHWMPNNWDDSYSREARQSLKETL